MPLQRRVPKRGFTPLERTVYQVVNLRDLDGLDETEITPDVLKAHGLIGHRRRQVKILGLGKIGRGATVSAHAFSRAAREKIRAAGGTVVELG